MRQNLNEKRNMLDKPKQKTIYISEHHLLLQKKFKGYMNLLIHIVNNQRKSVDHFNLSPLINTVFDTKLTKPVGVQIKFVVSKDKMNDTNMSPCGDASIMDDAVPKVSMSPVPMFKLIDRICQLWYFTSCCTTITWYWEICEKIVKHEAKSLI